MPSILSPPKPKLPPPPPPLPTREDPEVQRRKKEEQQSRKRRRGIGDTILTSGLGVTEAAPVTKKSLLGAP